MFAPRNTSPRLPSRTNPTQLPPRSTPPRTRAPISTEPAVIDTTPALARLIAGMKASFLPREEDTSIVRIVALSGHTAIDPLFLIRQDDTTILMGSGF